MSKRLARPQPITAPAPESFLPTFDFGAAPKPKSSAPLPPRKPVKLSKRLAAFTFLNLEDIVEEGDDSKLANASVDPLSPANSTLTTSSKSSRFLGFSRAKHAASPITPTDLPPMSSKAYATLVGGSGSKALFTPPPSKVIRPAPPKLSSTQTVSPVASNSKEDPKANPKSLAVDLVSIFSLSMSDEQDYNNTRFSFPMPPSFTPRRGSQSPLDPEMSFTASIQSPLSPNSPDSVTSGGTDFSFFSPLWSAGFTVPNFPPETPGELPPPLPEKTASPGKDKESRAQKGRSMRPVLTLIPPAGPPPRDSPPPTPSSTTDSPLYNSDRLGAGSPAPKRICPSPDLDPELSAAESTSSIASVLLGSNADSSADEWSDAEEDKDKVNIFGDWALGAPSRSGSIATITQHTVNAAMHRGSYSTIIAGAQGRNGSIASDMYDNWEQAIDDIFLASRKPSLTTSRRPSLASIALAASADGAASASTSFDVLEDSAFVMDEEMMRKLMESQFLVPTRGAPAPPSPTSSAAPSLTASASNSTTSLASTASASADATPSATSSARSSFEEERSSVGHGSAIHQGPLTPIQEEYVVDPTLLSRPRPARPAPIVTSEAYPPVAGLRLTKAEKRVSIAPFPTKEVTPLVMDRPPPAQSIPDEGAFFSPSSAGSRTPFSAPVDLDSWPVWTSIDDAIASKRNARRPSGGATTIMSKFSDDSIDVSKSRKRSGRTRTTKPAKSSSPKFEEEDTLEARLRKNGMIGTKVNVSPGSSHTSYTFLGMKKKKIQTDNASTSPTSKAAPSSFSPVRSPKDAKARSSFESSNSGSSDGKRTGLKRPTLPLELFIRT